MNLGGSERGTRSRPDSTLGGTSGNSIRTTGVKIELDLPTGITNRDQDQRGNSESPKCGKLVKLVDLMNECGKQYVVAAAVEGEKR